MVHASRLAGLRGELLVLADLVSKGYIVLRGMEGSPFDLVILLQDRFLRIQVKAVSNRDKRNPKVFKFSLRRAQNIGYTAKDCDMFALVELQSGQIAYMPRVRLSMITIKSDGFKKYDIQTAIKKAS